jgi:single-stranded-DNA-specific exonuclease
MSLFERILIARGLRSETEREAFLSPDYSLLHDPFLLPDMELAIDRLARAKKGQQKITIYGDYDVDGLTATALLLDAFSSFGFENVDVFMPNRFVDGYGMTVEAVEEIASRGTNLIVTVDCGSLSEKEIIRANELGVDVIVTDHHGVAEVQPPAIAIINPKRTDSKYPFSDLAGVGVAFKLVQAMQTKITGMAVGREKWLLDLVALGTVCDIVPLIDENRIYVFWGLKVLAKASRPGLRALMIISDINPKNLNARSLGFGLGPRMNAAGRIDTARQSLDLLNCDDLGSAKGIACLLDNMNKSRQFEQKKILKSAILQAEESINDSVLVVSNPDWSHGIVGIVASKLLEKYQKPVFVFQEMGEDSKGSARSFGDFDIAAAVKYAKDLIIGGGGHKLAAGVTLPTKNINSFRKKVNDFYKNQKLKNQKLLLNPKADADAGLFEVNEDLVELISSLEPFGNGNPQPILKTDNLTVVDIKKMGDNNQHIKIELKDEDGCRLKFLAFGAPEHFFVDIGAKVNVWYYIDINEWQGSRTVEGKLLHLEAE